MICEEFSVLIGTIKLFIFKLMYIKRIKIKGMFYVNNTFRIYTKKKSKIIVGKKFRARNNASLRVYGGELIIGDNCFFNENVSINCRKKISIGNNFKCGHNVVIIDHDHDYKNNVDDYKSEEIYIGDNVWIGANCTILRGTIIPDNSIIAAGTTLKKKINNPSLIREKKEYCIQEIGDKNG